jgi:orotidine-5'-phosphate decarboxylase
MTELVVALDTRSVLDACILVKRLGSDVSWYKVGPKLELADGFVPMIGWLKDRGLRVLLDRKLREIPTIVAEYTERALDLGVDALTVECTRASLSTAKVWSLSPRRHMEILAVGRLTSEGYSGLAATHDAALAREMLCGIVCHPAFIPPSTRSDILLTAVTGVRPAGWASNDHRSTILPEEAARAQAWLAIVGRPILEAADPVRAAAEIQDALERGASG